MLLYLIRHAESLPRDGLSHSQGETVGLSSIGKKQAQVLGRVLARAQIEAIFSSTMQRAKETAAIIQSFCHTPLTVDPRLNEHTVSKSETNRHTVRELRKKVRDERGFIPPGGESFRQAVGRFHEALEDIASRHSGNVAVVTHREIIQNFLLDEFLLPEVPPLHEASWSVLEWRNNAFRIISLNNSPFSYVFLWQKFKRRLKTLLVKGRLYKRSSPNSFS